MIVLGITSNAAQRVRNCRKRRVITAFLFSLSLPPNECMHKPLIVSSTTSGYMYTRVVELSISLHPGLDLAFALTQFWLPQFFACGFSLTAAADVVAFVVVVKL